MSAPTPKVRAVDRMALVLAGALGLRVAAAILVQRLAERKGTLCLFPDANMYWYLAGTIRRGEPFLVLQHGVPHYALRTPGYPLFLALGQSLCGASPLALRLIQACLGAVCAWLVLRLTRAVVGTGDQPDTRWGAPWLAAVLAAVDPYAVGTSELLLTEAVFIPLMLLSLWGLAVLWAPGNRGFMGWAAMVGAASGAAILARPSWALCVPLLLAAWVAFSGRGERRRALKGALLVALAAALVMTPWWVRNARVFGRFVPTALWEGASLYDGLNPHATGASDMDFLDDPDIWPLGEEAQDAELHRRAVAFARENPGRALALAAIKFARYWSPWPNADTLRSPWIAIASAAWSLPLYVLWVIGARDRRRDARAIVLLAGPLLYFCALHMVFAGSMRYRIPGEVPALGLAAIGLERLAAWRGSPRRSG